MLPASRRKTTTGCFEQQLPEELARLSSANTLPETARAAARRSFTPIENKCVIRARTGRAPLTKALAVGVVS
jgi:hypothetical protein